MKIVLDTNVLLVSLGKSSDYREIFDRFLNQEFSLYVTTDILLEYEEVISQHLGSQIASNLLLLLENSPNVFLATGYYKWNLIEGDPDDNKFVDCAVASNARYLVSNDKHFNVLKDIDFPKVTVLKAKQFLEEFNK